MPRYCPGGFHPVHLGDVLNDRYHVFRKLGSGSQSTVWLARNGRHFVSQNFSNFSDEYILHCYPFSSKQERLYVAIKVFEADTSSHQERIDQYLLRDQTPHSGADLIESLSLGSFTVTGPNGSHYCKVLEPLGGSLSTILDEAYDLRGSLNQGKPAQWKAQQGDDWQTAPAKRFCWQVPSGLSFLHSKKLAHRDTRPTNVFPVLQYDLNSMHENEIQKSVWPTDDKQDEDDDGESGDEEDEEDDEGEDGDDDEDDEDEDEEEDEDENESDEMEKHRQAFLETEAIINARWQSFDQGDRLATPHSEEWTKANLIGTRADIELLVRKDDKDFGPRDLQYTVQMTPVPGGLDLNKPYRVILGDLGFAFPFSECEENPIATEHVYRPPEDLLGLKTTYKADIFSAGLFCLKIVMLDELIQMLNGGGPGYTQSRQIYDLVKRLGPIPQELRARWKQTDEYIDADGNPLDLAEAERAIYGTPFSGVIFGTVQRFRSRLTCRKVR
ncbi:unnamed protein product [Clonostachys rosea]|uniref:non-specific serine/threonine protein kinase n=1 Tax=Bionectria ochroleuca TaxID=29856 RepID=A0ABY6V4Q7_BIOOC|nr:unnamed protein product [Clonostachys rosea]